MPIINGEEMRKKLEENLKRLDDEVKRTVQIQTPISQGQMGEPNVQAQGN